MTETPTAAELVITDRTLDAFHAVRFERDYADDLRAVAAPVVAAELRRIAEEIFDRSDDDNARWFEDLLRARADELDPPARQEN